MTGCGKDRVCLADTLHRLLQLPFVFIHPSKLKWVFNTKAVAVPIVACGTLIWVSRFRHDMSFLSDRMLTIINQAVVKAGSNAGEALSNPANRAAPGSARFIAFMYSVTACQGTWATLSQCCSN